MIKVNIRHGTLPDIAFDADHANLDRLRFRLLRLGYNVPDFYMNIDLEISGIFIKIIKKLTLYS